MIKQILFHNDTIADYIADKSEEEQLVRYLGRTYPLIEHPMSIEPFIEVYNQMWWLIGSIDVIDNVEVKLYWRSDDEHDEALKYAKATLKKDKGNLPLAFGAHEDVIFTEDEEGFKVELASCGTVVKQDLDEMRRFIDKSV